MQLLYNLAAILIVILIIPVFLVRAVRERGFVERVRQSLGFFPAGALDKVAKRNCIWVHAASVGEIVAASPLIREFRKAFPKSPILISVVTTSGYEMANRIIKDADSIIYFPLDLPWRAGNILRRIHPRVFMPVETELWPNFLRTARALNIPVMMVNGRISDKSVRQYKYLHSVLDDMIGTVKKFAMQSPIDAEYIMRLGAPPELVTVTGNTKFDQTYTDVSPQEKQALLQSLGLTDNDGIFLAGSTHHGEEPPVLAAFAEVRKQFPKAKLVIAPRELLRVSEVVSLVEKAGFSVRTRTDLQKNGGTGHDVVILDTIGELGRVYSVGDVVFVGGSLIAHGGHNILEPAAHGKAIIVGPNMFNFKDTHVLFTKRNACVTVRGMQELPSAVCALFANPQERHRMEQETLAIVCENKGASQKTAKILQDFLAEFEHGDNAGHVHATEQVENFRTYFTQLVHLRRPEGFLQHLFMSVLYAFSVIYRQLVDLKLALFRLGFFKRRALPCYVISLGNITVGGTGKTPTAQRLAADIRDLGYRVVILNRGYRAKWKGDVGIVSDGKKLYMNAAQAGDEAFMLAKHLPNVPVLIGAERYLTGRYAVEHFGAEVAILDDGYQHWQLARDMDMLLVDAVNVFGNGYMLPRGTLREPISHIERADVCLLTKVDQAVGSSRAHIQKTIREYNQKALLVESVHQPRSFIELRAWHQDIANEGLAVSAMQGKKVMAVSAIGNPASFEQTLHDVGVEIVESLRFPDHHEYTVKELQGVIERAAGQGVEAIVITEKDAVKIPLAMVEAEAPIPFYVISVAVTFQKGAEAFHQHLQANLAAKLKKLGKRAVS